ncbi:Putative cytochrome P450 [Septoria linicola]|uniref:Cytochrome P450 n=1 Tax=Septoria linicola TaxID=215465 RepID=A0A9Q9AKC7_9PEZI|nr:Putative cytochrome P450 [Septoria linicola]
MTTQDFLAPKGLVPGEYLKISGFFIAIYIIYATGRAIYTAFLGPLRKFPGPRLRALSRYPELWTLAKGDEGSDYVALHAKYGPVVRIGPTQLSYAGGAQAWKDIYGFRKQGQAGIFKEPEFYSAPFNNVDHLITADDATHGRQRKLLSHSFADKTLKDLEPLLKYWVTKMRTKLEERINAGEKVDILKYYNCTTFDIMGDLSFGENLGMLDNGEYSSWVKAMFLGIKDGVLLRSLKLINWLTEWVVDRFLMNSPTVRVKQAEHWNYSKDRVDRRLAKTPDRVDLWTKILEKSKLAENGLTVDEHHSNASLFMIAGTETTATALSGLTYYLLRNPQYLNRLAEEIRSAHDTVDDITLESIQNLKYLRAVLQEGLRMYPPVPSLLPRRVPKGGAMVDGEFVPGGTTLGVHQLATYRSEANFKHAHEFRPERWLGDPEYKDDRLDSLEPFSVGPRNCIGKNLAWHEMRLILSTTLYSFDLQLCEESMGWQEQKVWTLWEKRPLMCTLTLAQR